MRIGLVTTTINVPRVLALYRAYGPDVRMFVVGDSKSPDESIASFLSQNDIDSTYYPLNAQYKLGYESARAIPEGCIQRRNIGFLEALRWGAEIVVSLDDDNIALNKNYFVDFQNALTLPFNGLRATSPTGWFDVGQLLQPKAPHRGMPRDKIAQPFFEAVTDVKVGIAAGLCLGDPDVAAVDRMANGPLVQGVSAVAQSGCVVDPGDTWTVWNSQNTAIVRELLPAWFMFPHIGRADDIFASFVVQRIMREFGYVAHFGLPMIWQSRNPHDLNKDLLDELLCMRQALPMTEWLDKIQLTGTSVFEKTIDLFAQLAQTDILPRTTTDAARLWLRDCDKVL